MSGNIDSISYSDIHLDSKTGRKSFWKIIPLNQPREIGEIYEETENKVKCKMGIRKELFIFLSAILSGAIVRLVYRCISCLRNVVHHAHWVIELEDLASWSEPRFFCLCRFTTQVVVV